MNHAIIHGSFVRKETRNLNFEDQDAIDAAVLPNLEPISLNALESAVSATRANSKVTVQALLIFAVILVIAIATKGYTFALAIGSAILVMLIGAFILHLRAQLDETAVMMQIPIHHIEEKGAKSYAVCYLPDGKYLFRCAGGEPAPAVVCYIEFGKFTYCLLEKAPRKSPAASEAATDTLNLGETEAEAAEDET